jgi:hypothetical protein
MSGAKPEQDITYTTPAAFLHEYENTIARGSLLLPWDDPKPEKDAQVRAILKLPGIGREVPLDAVVAFSSPAGVLLDLSGLDDAARTALGECAALCKAPEAQAAPAAAPSAAAAPEAQPPPAEPTLTGTYEDTPAVRVLWNLSRKGATGSLRVTAGDARSDIYFHKGRVARILRDPLPQGGRLGELLVTQELLTEQQRDQALEAAADKRVPIGQALLAAKAITKSELATALSKQLQRRLVEEGAHASGQFAFYANAPIGKAPVSPPIYPIRAIFRATVDRYARRLAEEVESIEATYADMYVFPGDNAPEDITELGLNDKEKRFWAETVIGQYRLRDLYPVSKLGRRYTHAVLFALVDLGAVKFEDTMASERRTSKVSEALERKHGELTSGTLFDRLEVHWGSTDEDIERGFRRMRAEYNPSALPPDFPQNLRKLVEEIADNVDEAYQRLRVKEERQRYRRTIQEDSKLKFAAGVLMQQGEIALMRHDFVSAYDRYSHAHEIWPGLAGLAEKLRNARAGLPKKPRK